MGKTVMTLVIPDPKVRKPQPKAAQKHKDKTKYTRKVKHKAPDWGPCHAEVVIFSLSGAAPEHNVFEAFPRLSTSISPAGADDGHGPLGRPSERAPLTASIRPARRKRPSPRNGAHALRLRLPSDQGGTTSALSKQFQREITPAHPTNRNAIPPRHAA